MHVWICELRGRAAPKREWWWCWRRGLYARPAAAASWWDAANDSIWGRGGREISVMGGRCRLHDIMIIFCCCIRPMGKWLGANFCYDVPSIFWFLEGARRKIDMYIAQGESLLTLNYMRFYMTLYYRKYAVIFFIVSFPYVCFVVAKSFFLLYTIKKK